MANINHSPPTPSISTSTSSHKSSSSSSSSSSSTVIYSKSYSPQKSNDKKSPDKADKSSLRQYSQQRRAQSLIPQTSSVTQDQNRRPSSPAFSSSGRLSIADRFMSAPYQHSPSTSSPLSYSSIILTEREDESPRVSQDLRSDNSAANARTSAAASSVLQKSSTTNSLSQISNSAPKLTIANSFMKSSSLQVNQDSINTSGGIHPLDDSSEDTNIDLDLNLNLTSPSTSSISPSFYRSDSYNRPFGSQDTLVSNNRGGSGNDSNKPPSKVRQSSLEEEYFDVSLDDYYRRRNTDENDNGDDDDCDEVNENESDLSSTTRHGDEEHDFDLQQSKSSDKRQRQQDDDEKLVALMDEPNGYWIACCFLSCGRRRPTKRAMMTTLNKKQQRRQQSRQQQKGCGRPLRVFALFLSILILILISIFFWPRTPLIRVEGASLLSPARITETNQGAMVGNVQFESQWMVNFTVDNRENWLLPTRLVQLHVLVKDALTGNVIAKGFQNDRPETLVLDPRTISTVQLGVSLDYQARDVSDTTFASLKKACTNPSSSPPTRRSLLTVRADDNNSTSLAHYGPSNTTAINTVNASNNNTTANQTLPSNVTSNNQTAHSSSSSSSLPVAPAAPKEHESLSLLFWVTLHIWGLDFFGYRPTVMVAPATGGFVCPLS